MSSTFKSAIAVFLNLSLLVNQLSADLQQITFDSAEWIPLQPVGASAGSGWWSDTGNAMVSPVGAGFGGGKALLIPANAQEETRISRTITWNPSDSTSFIDFQVKPAADPEGGLASIYVNGSQLAFQVPEGSNTGEVWVYQGNDGAENPETQPEEWIKTAGTFAVASGATAATNYLRMTFRHDYQRNLWDLFIDGKLAAANLSFEERGDSLQSIYFYGSKIGDTHVDNLAALSTNMLFPDADKDGLPDAWETANGSNPNLYDRDAIKPGGTRSFLDLYMDSLWVSGGANGAGTLPSSSGIPPLTIDSEAPHQAVGAMKGSLSVGGDGSASYSVPIDIPKGTAGMEPKLSLGYSSNGGNGIAGVGWNLSGLQTITRGTSSAAKDGSFDPMNFDSSDRFFLDGERLVCVSGTYGAPGSEYRTEIDSFARITAIGVGPELWKIETKAGLIVTLGETSTSKFIMPVGTLSWSVSRVQDTVGNYYTVDYERDTATIDFDSVNQRVSAIHYTGNANNAQSPYCHVMFDYEDRPDLSRSYSKYVGSCLTKRLSKIRVLSDSFVNHSYVLTYANSYQTGRSFLGSISKRIGDDPARAVPATTFNYDGLQQGEEIWLNPGSSRLATYSTNVDATGEVNSMVTTEDNNTTIRLTGDVARAYMIPVTSVQSDTKIQFDFKSNALSGGAVIGLDSDVIYNCPNSYPQQNSKLYRIGGSGDIRLAPDQDFKDPYYRGPTQAYTVGEGWKTFTLDATKFGTGTKQYLALICVDGDISDGTSEALFRNVKIYNSNTQIASSVSPIVFDLDVEMPRFSSSAGKDFGVASIDLNADGLPDLADWRVVDYTVSSGNLLAKTIGNTFRNTGSGFLLDNSLCPPPGIPLSVRSESVNAYNYNKKHHLIARPIDINGDGRLDLLASVNSKRISNVLKNEYAFYTWNGAGWSLMPATFDLPFRYENTASDESYGGKRRDFHFEWMDLNSDGYQDLSICTTSTGRLYDKVTNSLIADGNASVAYINPGKSGGSWTFDNSYRLPERLMQLDSGLPKDIGRRVLDLEGDGVIDIAQARDVAGSKLTYKMLSAVPNGAYRWNSTPELQNPPPSAYDFPMGLVNDDGVDRNGVNIFDCNGDSLPDLLRYVKKDGAPEWNTWLNRGNRHSSPWVEENPATDTASEKNSYKLPLPLHFLYNDSRIPYGFDLADLNGDGLVDILYANPESSFTPGPDNLAILNTGNGWEQRTAWKIPDGKLICELSDDLVNGKRRAKVQDINGDGFPDLITNILDQTPRVWYNQCRPEVLTTVTDGFGSELQVEYHRLNDPTPTPGFGTRVYEKCPDVLPMGHAAIIDSRLVVSAYSEPDGNGGRRYRSQRYGDLRYDRYNESSLGFGWIEAKDELNNQTTRTEASREFPFGGSPVWTRTWVEVKPGDLSAALPGVTAGTKCLSEETGIYAEMSLTTGNAGGTIRRPVQTQSVKTLYDLSGNVLSRTTSSQNLADFDAYGFVKYSTSTSLDGTIVATTSAFTHTVDANRWHLGRLSQASTTKSGGNKPSLAKTSSFTYDSTNGLLKTETIQPGNALSVTKSYTHDGFGNVIASSITGSGLTRSSTSIYDSQGRFVLAESNQLGHTVSYNYDAQRALLLSTTDIAGKTTGFGYDAFGTVIRTWHPDSTQTGESTGFTDGSQLPPSVTALVTNPIRYYRAKQSSGAPVSKVYLDALGREIVAESTILRDAAASGAARYSKIYTVSQYDVLGRKTRATEPFGAGDTPLATQIRYDFLSRVAETIHPDDQSDSVLEFSTLAHYTNPLTYSKVRNARNGVLERWEDQHGRLIQSRDPSGQTTVFNHDQEGRILSVAINGATLLTNTFDLFGNKTQVTEVNSGTSSSIYNALGEVTSSTNAKGQVTTFAYDVLGRATTVARPEGSYTTTYDGARGSGLGKPWKTTGPNGYQESVSYDNFGRTRSATTTRFGESFTTTSSYDALGRPLTETDAGGLTVVHEYDPNYSFPTALRIGPGSEGAGTLLWQAGTFDSKGRAISQTLAQGVSASATYHTATGLLATMNASQGGTSLQAKSYAWDSLGNLTARNDTLTARGETFSYDTLNRVTGSTVATLPGSTISTVPPPAAYAYATNGNLLSKPGLSNVVYGGPRPHAVTSANVKGVTRAYTYDAAGYVTADGKRTYTWASFGQLSSLDYLSAPALQTFSGVTVYQASRVQSDFSFDAGGNRAKQLKQRIAANDSRMLEETLYLGSYEREIHMTKASAAASPVVTKTVHRHNLGGFAVYTKTAKPGLPDAVKLSTILKDHLGSTDLILTSAWNGSTFANPQTERQSFNPWGERRAADTQVTYRASDSDPFRTSAQDYDRGYTGHEQLDDSGLIHMNGRIYDPELGRMLSPDPVVQVPEYSQNFNRYSYVMNNPLNLTDPTGFSWLSNAFHKLGSWIKENWRTVVVIVIMAVIVIATCGTLTGGAAAMGSALLGATATAAVTATVGSWAVAAIGGAFLGGIAGGLTAALNGGDLGDVLRGAMIGGISGALTAGLAASDIGGVAQITGQGVVGGARNAAMGGKFQDGFLSAAASSAAQYIPGGNSGTAGLIKSSVVGGTASSLGGGKFANGATTAAFQYLVTSGLESAADKSTSSQSVDKTALKYADKVYTEREGGDLRSLGIGYMDNVDGLGAALYLDPNGINYFALRGTQLFSLMDWKNNILQALGFHTPQYDMAIQLAKDVYRETVGNVTFVGHSLGGGLASAAAGATGGTAITFNAAGLSSTYSGSPGNVTAYYIRGDILSTAQDFSPLRNAIGMRIGSSGSGGPISRHLLYQFGTY